MKRLLLFLLISLLLSACAPATRNGTNPVLSPMLDGMYDNNPILVNQRLMPIQRIIDSVYFLHTDTEFKLEDGEVITAELDGTGVLILDRYILTVSHAVSHDSLQVEMLTPMGIQRVDAPAEKLSEKTSLNLNGSRIRLEEVVKGKEDDIAIFKVPDGFQLNSFPYEIGNSDELQVGDFIYVVGNPMNYGINVREGIVSSMVAPEAIAAVLPRFENAFMISNGVNPGDSGTPVIAIRDGKFELVGLSQGIFTNAQSLSWAIKINPILNKLEDGMGKREHPQMKGGKKFPEEYTQRGDVDATQPNLPSS
ncbi:MAG: trypsin-like serine protease [Proteobacteria bacterium]|nr:trypsin-like serine protease [Pseudomonadota bacterium]